MKTKRLGARWLVVGLALSTIALACGRSSGDTSPDGGGGPECQTDEECGGGQRCFEGNCISSGQLGDSGAGDLPAQGGATSPGGSVGVGGTGHILEGGAHAGGAPPSSGGEADAGAPPVDPCSSCALTQTCVAGACQDILCTPGSTSCVEGNVWKCNANGTARALSSDCKDDEFCAQQGDSASCSPTKCVPGAVMCDGQVATRCRADGSAPQAGGQDCAASSEVCYDGQCLTRGCTPGEKLCQHDDVYLCTESGTNTVSFENCTDDEACDPTLGQCRKRLCTPGLLGCDGSRVARCGAFGVSWEQTGTDCATSDALCVEGSCKPLICTPSTSFCVDSAVYACDSLGIKKTLQERCGDAYYCSSNASWAYCAYDSCVASAPACNGNSVTSCAPDGSRLLPGGTPCPDGKGCSGGVCKTQVCSPNAAFCQDNTPAYCGANGIDVTLYSACGADASCQMLPNYGPSCVQHECKPGDRLCLGNQVGTCGDGFSLASVDADCAGAKQVCDGNLECANDTLDAWGGATDLKSFAAGEVAGDAIKVQSSRTLTQIEANLILASPRDLTWVVLDYSNSGYAEVFAKQVTGQSGSGYFSSGPINVTLQPGKTYILGVRASASIAAYHQTAPWPAQTSFGQVLGGLYRYYYSYYIDPGTLFDERISTTF